MPWPSYYARHGDSTRRPSIIRDAVLILFASSAGRYLDPRLLVCRPRLLHAQYTALSVVSHPGMFYTVHLPSAHLLRRGDWSAAAIYSVCMTVVSYAMCL